MRIPSEKQAVRRVSSLLADLLGVEGENVRPQKGSRSPGADAVIEVAKRVFAIEWKNLARCILVQNGVK
jgi:hypothetical protein